MEIPDDVRAVIEMMRKLMCEVEAAHAGGHGTDIKPAPDAGLGFSFLADLVKDARRQGCDDAAVREYRYVPKWAEMLISYRDANSRSITP